MKLLTSLFITLISLISFSQQINSNGDKETLIVVDKAPVHKKCDINTDNDVLKKCMISAIVNHISKNFNTSIAKKLNIPSGIVEIQVLFEVSKKGRISNIKATSSHNKLEEEAIRVFKKIPKFKEPAYLKGEPITVSYTIPIKFGVK